MEDSEELTSIEEQLTKAGVSIAFRRRLDDGVAIGVRVDARSDTRWNDFIRELTYRSAVANSDAKGGVAKYYIETAKVFYYSAEARDTVWMWRLVLRGDLQEIEKLISRQDFTDKVVPMVLTSFPLGPGRVIGQPGSLKGVHANGAGDIYAARAADRSAEVKVGGQ